MEEHPPVETFDIEKSPLKEAYKLLGANTPLELSLLYTQKDQELMKLVVWVYNNFKLKRTRIKNFKKGWDPRPLT